MTAHAARGKYFQPVCLLRMNVVAGRAIKGALLETFARAQKTILVAMYVQRRGAVCGSTRI